MSLVTAPAPDESVAGQVSLTLTGIAHRARLLVLIGRRQVYLTTDQFELLATFAQRRRQSSTGRITRSDVLATTPEHFRMKVCRLRNQLSAAIGSGVGDALIVNGLVGEYRLAVAPSAIYADRSCREIAAEFPNIDFAAFPEPPHDFIEVLRREQFDS